MFRPFAEIWGGGRSNTQTFECEILVTPLWVVSFQCRQVFAPVFRLQIKIQAFGRVDPGVLKCQISPGVDGISPKRRAEMFGLVFILIPSAALHLAVAFPTMPLSSPQSWRRPPGTQQQITCVGVGSRGAPEQEDASVPAHETQLQL